MPTARLFLVAIFAIACQQAAAQTAVTTPALEVQRLGPHLVAFTGSQANFQNLVTGLAQGRPVQLVTVLPDGSTQLVTFTPATAMSPSEIVQMLETTRQGLIGLGIGTPTAEQLALALTGGAVPTPLGGSTVAGALTSPAAQIQSGSAAAGATATGAVTVQVLPPTAPRVNTSDSAIPAGATSRSPQSAPTSTTPQSAPTSTTPQSAPTSTTPPLAATPSPAPSSAPAPMSPGQAPPAFGAR